MEVDKRILEILENILYWETCPEYYKKDIRAFLNKQKEVLAITDVGISETELCGICKENIRIVTGKICEYEDCVRYR